MERKQKALLINLSAEFCYSHFKESEKSSFFNATQMIKYAEYSRQFFRRGKDFYDSLIGSDETVFWDNIIKVSLSEIISKMC